MFRTAAALRSAASAAARRSVVANSTSRSFSSVVSRPTLAASRAVSVAPVSRVAGPIAVRCYAAGSGLSKEDVEGRITSLLAGFDKVRFCVGSLAGLRQEVMSRRQMWSHLDVPRWDS